MGKEYENDFFDKRKEKIKNFKLHIDTVNKENDLVDISIGSDEGKVLPKSSVNNEKRPSVKEKNQGKNFNNKESSNFFKHMWVAMVVLVSFVLSQYSVAAFNDMLAMSRTEGTTVVEIPKDANSDTFAKVLYDNKVINNPNFFKNYIMLTGSYKNFKSGSFEMRTNMDYQAIKSCLTSNEHRLDSDIIDVLIPEGKNILEISHILDKNEICSENDFLKACNSSEFEKKYEFLKNLENSEKRPYKLEGYLFPDTYKFYKYSDGITVVKKFLANYNKKVSKKYAVEGSKAKVNLIQRVEESGMTMDNVMNLASLIQAEAASEADMYNVSSVIHNRLETLKHGDVSPYENASVSLLGIDSTVWYPYRSKDKVPAEKLSSFEGIYDTYKNKGLPIGPICNPGMEAINAALKPNKTQYYYFCHSKDGKAYYAKNGSEHIANLKRAGLS